MLTPDPETWKPGDIVQRGSSRCVIVSMEYGSGDYNHVTVRCLESNDDWLPVGAIDETFAGRLAFLERGNNADTGTGA